MGHSYNTIMNRAMETALAKIEPGDTDYVRMECDVMSEARALVMEMNTARAPGTPWIHVPNRLEPAQIATILEKAMRGRLRSVGQSPDRRGSLQVRQGDGTWSGDTDEICRACIALDYGIARRGIAAAIDRLLFLVPRAEDMEAGPETESP